MPTNPTLLARLRRTGAATLLVAAAGCTEFLTVPNPTVIDAGSINPISDAPTLANSAQQNFVTAFGLNAMYQGWFTGEIAVAETFPTRNEFGRRDIVPTNGSLNADTWAPLSVAISSARFVMGLALPTPATNINRNQAALFSGYSFLMMAESFCLGTVSSGPKLTTNDLLDSAIANFTIAITIGRAINSATSNAYANAAFMGRARANLMRGNTAAASTDADSVPVAFVFNALFVDDLSNRTRLSNTFWQFTRDRGSVSVDTAWRKLDPRVTYVNGATLTPPLSAQDATNGVFYVQQKYPGYATSIRLASKLEADYLKQEAVGGVAGQTALINTRRTAAGLPPYAGAATAPAVLLELMTQKGFDFFLEGKRMGDFRRNPTSIAGLPPSGGTFFKPGFSTIGTNTCFPVPFAETSTNSNFP